MPTLGTRIKELRKEKGMTQQHLADVMSVTKGTVSVWERDQKRPTFEKLEALCSLFAVQMTFLLGENASRTPGIPTDNQLAEWSEEDEYEEAKQLRHFARMMAKLSKPTQRIIFAAIREAYKVDEENGVLKTQV